jgi:uncharacterized protein GlcG (DUF336 family)
MMGAAAGLGPITHRYLGGKMNAQRWLISGFIGLGISAAASPGFAQIDNCVGLPSQSALQAALANVVPHDNGGLGFNMWASLVATDGTVCAVVFSGNKYTDQWLGSRVISAQKANTANAFSLGTDANIPAGSVFPHGLALSTANLYSAVQPGGFLYGLQHSNPVDPTIAYEGEDFRRVIGTIQDPLVGHRIGGVNVFGGGLALFASGGKKVGAVGVSGDTSCTDHYVAWQVRNALGLDHFGPAAAGVGGVSGDSNRPDNMIFDFVQTADGGILNPNPGGKSVASGGGFGHPICDAGNGALNPQTLPPVQHN